MNREDLKKICNEATPAPWGPYISNSPFYAVVNKPAPSLSRNDHIETYWRVEDALFLAAAREWMPKLLEENSRLRDALKGGDNG
jgi:hypothetical protein